MEHHNSNKSHYFFNRVNLNMLFLFKGYLLSKNSKVKNLYIFFFHVKKEVF